MPVLPGFLIAAPMTSPDPTPLLSTIATVSAAMVAIVGGLLVARFVTIASEQEGAEQLLRDARGRLTTVQGREQEARERLRNWDINDFFDVQVIRAISGGQQDIHALRRIGDYSSLTDDQLAEVVQTISREFATARSTLTELLAGITGEDSPAWEDFRHAHPSLPQTKWDEVWELVYENIVRPPRPQPSSAGWLGSLGTPIFTRPIDMVVLDAQRRDALRADLARAEQRAEDIEEEVARLQQARDAIVRPKGLGWGLVVLGFFTLVGVIAPIWLMSRAPQRLTTHLGEVVFWLFLAGLLALLGYMSALALRLSGWRHLSI